MTLYDAADFPSPSYSIGMGHHPAPSTPPPAPLNAVCVAPGRFLVTVTGPGGEVAPGVGDTAETAEARAQDLLAELLRRV